MRIVAPISAAGFVLAGGRSSRMGTDKTLALLAGSPLIQIALTTVAAAGVPAKIAGARSPLAAFAEEIPDTWPNSGPLGGIHAALSAPHADWNLFLPVDLPLMPASLLACLLQRASLTGQPVTATRLNGRLEPLPVVLHRSVLPFVSQCLGSGKPPAIRPGRPSPRSWERSSTRSKSKVLSNAASAPIQQIFRPSSGSRAPTPQTSWRG